MSKHPLAQQRTLLLAAYNQVYELVAQHESQGLNSKDLNEDLKRIHLRLIKCQEMCRKFGV